MHKFLLIGPSGIGKSTALEKLAKDDSIEIFDLDILLEKQAGMNLTKYYAELGHQRFFEKSKEIIESLCSEKNIVIAVGAGSIEFEGGHAWFNSQNTIALIGEPKTIYERSNRKMYHPTFDSYSSFEYSPTRRALYKSSKYKIDVTKLNEDAVPKKIAEIIAPHI